MSSASEGSGARARVGKYDSYAALSSAEILGRDYRVRWVHRASPLVVVAPHGGLIEDGTSELAFAIAADEHSLFSFEGLKPYGQNRDLHITSHRFDHPRCIELVTSSALVLGVHGCRGSGCIHLGGLDRDFVGLLCVELAAAGFSVEPHSWRYPGRHPLNICNRGATGAGAQIEVTHDLRGAEHRESIARAVRAAIGVRCARIRAAK
jgi:phage replication-related protein YjqB (UPF0714/DUF867 family)